MTHDRTGSMEYSQQKAGDSRRTQGNNDYFQQSLNSSKMYGNSFPSQQSVHSSQNLQDDYSEHGMLNAAENVGADYTLKEEPLSNPSNAFHQAINDLKSKNW